MKLTELPNIGKVLALKLKTIGVNTPDELKRLGSEKVIIRIDALEDGDTCLHMLYALEGAVQGIRWHHLSKDRKQELSIFFRMLNQ